MLMPQTSARAVVCVCVCVCVHARFETCISVTLHLYALTDTHVPQSQRSDEVEWRAAGSLQLPTADLFRRGPFAPADTKTRTHKRLRILQNIKSCGLLASRCHKSPSPESSKTRCVSPRRQAPPAARRLRRGGLPRILQIPSLRVSESHGGKPPRILQILAA